VLAEQNGTGEEEAFLTDKLNIQENEAGESSPDKEAPASEASPTLAVVPAE
jgi:hypothetical protein